MSQPIDRAYVELAARGEKDAARAIKRALDQIARDVKRLSEQIQNSIGNAANDIEREITQAGDAMSREAAGQRKEWKKTGTSLALAMKEAAESAENSVDDFADEAVRDLNRVTRAAARAAVAVRAAGTGTGTGAIDGGLGGGVPDRDINLGIGGPDRDVNRIRRSLDGLGNILGGVTSLVREFIGDIGDRLGDAGRRASQALTQLGGVLRQVFGPLREMVTKFGILPIAIAAVLPVVIPLIAALSQLSGLLLLLPGIIGVLVAAAVPLFMAFKGIGDAVSALASGDLEKINEAMKNLSPQARKFAVELHSIRDELKQLRLSVQDSFFKEFNGALTELATYTFPVLEKGLSRVSGALGRMGFALADLFSSNDILEVFGDIFESTERIIDRLSPKFVDFLGSIVGMIEHSLPFVERFFAWIGDGMKTFSNWIGKAMADGRFEEWLENAFTVAKDLWGLLKSIGRLFGAIFGGLGDDGQDFLKGMTEGIDKLTAWFESPQGKKEMQDLVDTLKEVGKATLAVIDAIIGMAKWFGDRKQDWEDFKQGADDAGDAIVNFFKDIWGWIQGAGQSIGDFFTDIGDWISDASDAVVERGGDILDWFEELPGKIGGWLSRLPGVVGRWIAQTMDDALYSVGFAIGSIARFFVDLPGNIEEALEEFWDDVTTWFEDTREDAIESAEKLISGVLRWFNELPGRASRALERMWTNVTSWFSRTRDDSTARVRSAADSVGKWFREMSTRAINAVTNLPSRITAILRRIVDRAGSIGRDIMNGIAQGIRNGWNSAINAASDAARRILQGFWNAFRIGSPSKVTADTVGVPIMQGVGVGIEDEVPRLQSLLDRAMKKVIDFTGNVAEGTSSRGGYSSAKAAAAGIVIEQLTIPITGMMDFTNPLEARKIAAAIYEALENLKRDYS